MINVQIYYTSERSKLAKHLNVFKRNIKQHILTKNQIFSPSFDLVDTSIV